jgi:hypothetical protein
VYSKEWGGGGEIQVQWTVFRHTMQSFGISDVVSDSANWSEAKKEEFSVVMRQLVASLACLKDLAGTETQIDERSELVSCLLLCHLPRGHFLRCDPNRTLSPCRRIVLLALLALHLGLLSQPSAFDVEVEEDQINRLNEAISIDDEESLLTFDCGVVCATLLKGIRDASIFPTSEECCKGATDWFVMKKQRKDLFIWENF